MSPKWTFEIDVPNKARRGDLIYREEDGGRARILHLYSEHRVPLSPDSIVGAQVISYDDSDSPFAHVEMSTMEGRRIRVTIEVLDEQS